MQTWHPAYIGIGSNLGDPARQVAGAMQRLAGLPGTRLVLRSPLYASRPMGPQDQPDFVNAAAGLLTTLEPLQLLDELQRLELSAGRPAEHEYWGPRVLDLDLLLYGRMVLGNPRLTLPHPGVVERNFVLYPLAAIAPDAEVPGRGRVRDLAARASADGIRLLGGTRIDWGTPAT